MFMQVGKILLSDYYDRRSKRLKRFESRQYFYFVYSLIDGCYVYVQFITYIQKYKCVLHKQVLKWSIFAKF